MQSTNLPSSGSRLRHVVSGTAEQFRSAWRGLGASVAVIATELNGRKHAMLATAVCSVSMEPPSLLICVNRSASAYEALASRGAFSLGILSARDVQLGRHIGAAKGDDRFTAGTWRSLSKEHGVLEGLPWLSEAQTTIFCSTDTATDYGSHTIFIGLVEAIVPSLANDPLVYCDGQYRSLGSAAA